MQNVNSILKNKVMAAVKYILQMCAFLGVLIWLLKSCAPERLEPQTTVVNTQYYGGIIIREPDNGHIFPPTRVCRYVIDHVKTVLPKSYIDSQLGTKCTVESLDSSVQGYYSTHDAFMVSWPGGLAVRIYVVNSSRPFRIKGISTNGELPEWTKYKQQ